MASRLLCCLRTSIAKILCVAAGAANWWRRSVWPAHLKRLAADRAYAAAAGAILAGLLGLLPAPEVIAAVLTAIVSALLRDRHSDTGPWPGRVDPRDFV